MAFVQTAGTPSAGGAEAALSARLQEQGARLAKLLRTVAEEVELGRAGEPADAAVAALGAWRDARDRLVESLRARGVDWVRDSGYAVLEELLAERARVRERKIFALRTKAATYGALVAAADGPEEAAGLRRALESVERDLAEALSDAPAVLAVPDQPVRAGGPTEPTPDPSPDPPDPNPDPDSAPGPMAAPEAARPVVPEAVRRDPLVPAAETPVPAPAAETPVPAPNPGSDRKPGQHRDQAEEQHGAGAVGVPPEPARPAEAPVGIGTSAPVAEEPWPDGLDDPDWDPRAPWESGEDAPVARLVREARMAEAYWMTAASDEPPARAQALAFAAAAYSCVSDADATPVQIVHELDADLASRDREAHLVALTAALRTGLTARWAHPLVSGFNMPSGLTAPWQDLLNVLVAAVRNGGTFVPGMPQPDEGQQEHAVREELGTTARQLLDDLPRRKTQYQRASQVLKYLVGPSGKLREALNLVIGWAEQGTESTGFRELGEHLLRAEDIDRLIDDTDAQFRTSKQAKEPITAGALRQLHTVCRSVGELLMRAEAASSGTRRVPSAERGVPGLAAARRVLREEPEAGGVGGAALTALNRWLAGELPARVDTVERLRTDGGVTPPEDCLLGLPELPRLPGGEPDLTDRRTPRRMAALLVDPDAERALTHYLDHGDLHLAKELVAAVSRDAGAFRCADPEWPEIAGRRWSQSHDEWRRRLAGKHRSAAGLLAEIRTLNLDLAPDTEREFTGRLQEFADGEESGRYRYALAALADLEAELTGLRHESTSRLREDLVRLRANPDQPLGTVDHDRIARLIDEGDTVTAQEFLALATSRQALPERPEDDGSELAEFLAGLTGPGAPRAGGEGVDAAWWVGRYGPDGRTSLTTAAEVGLESWKALCTRHGRSSEWQQHIPQVLRLLGLELVGSDLTPERLMRGQGMRRFRVRAGVAERPGYVAALGSRAAAYTVQLIWEQQPADGPLAHLEDADVGANIVLYLHPLGEEGRVSVAGAARKSAQQALVVDPAVIGWMAARAPGAFRSLQRVTLPWAAYNPYTPFVAGLVPPEVFYGRDEEINEVMSRDGGLFLYGGRQLGKSALLRRVAEIFPSRSSENVAVYLDLLKAEIGHAEAPDQIWDRLAEALRRQGVFESRRSDRVDPESVVKRIAAWLDEDKTRRVLVLADEADAFLNTDSRRAYRLGSESTFPNVMRFQRLMEQTERRFKIVFAGLHQVQRFGHLSNVSTAHGGPDVLVGPLVQKAAVRLVTEPMAALGYVFERPELVWRILAITNYQANLVQIFCRELVRTLHTRAYQFTGGAVEVTDDDVQRVAGSETIRRQIAERLRFTINLEDRYRVLALVIALRSLADGYRGGYTANELLQEAREAWPQGFEMLSAKQVQIFLTEMVGLGLLFQHADHSRFAVRSPNVVNMLGTREELKLELEETEFALPYDYNPRAARRILGRDTRRDVQRYSPLTEEQLHETAQPGVSVVGVTDLYRPELILKAVEAFATTRGVEVVTYQRGADFTPAFRGARRRPQVVIVDLRGSSPAELRADLAALVAEAGPAAADKLVRPAGRRSRSADNRAVVVVAAADLAAQVLDAEPGEGLPVRRLRPERWSADALRAWSECPFASREDRARLVAATGGWPQWTELAVAEVSVHGATLDSAGERVLLTIAKPANIDQHLKQSGLGDRDLELLKTWTCYVEEGQGLPRGDIEAAVELPPAPTAEWLDRLDHLGLLDEKPDGFALDPVTYRAVRSRVAGEQ